MTTYTARTRSEEIVQLFSNETYTLAIGSPDAEFIESTPRLLFELFDSVALGALIHQVKRHGEEEQKLLAAWNVYDLVYGKI